MPTGTGTDTTNTPLLASANVVLISDPKTLLIAAIEKHFSITVNVGLGGKLNCLYEQISSLTQDEVKNLSFRIMAADWQYLRKTNAEAALASATMKWGIISAIVLLISIGYAIGIVVGGSLVFQNAKTLDERADVWGLTYGALLGGFVPLLLANTCTRVYGRNTTEKLQLRCNADVEGNATFFNQAMPFVRLSEKETLTLNCLENAINPLEREVILFAMRKLLNDASARLSTPQQQAALQLD